MRRSYFLNYKNYTRRKQPKKLQSFHQLNFRLAEPLPSFSRMEDYVKNKLNTKVLKKVGANSGCISNASIYETDYNKIFLKYSSDEEAEVMFKGEFESLKELSLTETVKVPKPLVIGKTGKKCFIVTEFLDIQQLVKYSSHLGKLLAEMHLANIKKLKEKRKSAFLNCEICAVDRFGFHVPTACGYISQNNEWCGDWVSFYVRQKLLPQIQLVLSKDGNRVLNELWSHLQLKIPSFFNEITVQPSLLHGDLWFGNCGETFSEPVVFDPASFYGHHEFDLAIAAMFNGFGDTFFEAYHSLLPKDPGFKKRHQLYLLFHHLNHWNHFGSHKESSLRIIQNLVNATEN